MGDISGTYWENGIMEKKTTRLCRDSVGFMGSILGLHIGIMAKMETSIV